MSRTVVGSIKTKLPSSFYLLKVPYLHFGDEKSLESVWSKFLKSSGEVLDPLHVIGQEEFEKATSTPGGEKVLELDHLTQEIKVVAVSGVVSMKVQEVGHVEKHTISRALRVKISGVAYCLLFADGTTLERVYSWFSLFRNDFSVWCNQFETKYDLLEIRQDETPLSFRVAQSPVEKIKLWGVTWCLSTHSKPDPRVFRNMVPFGKNYDLLFLCLQNCELSEVEIRASVFPGSLLPESYVLANVVKINSVLMCFFHKSEHGRKIMNFSAHSISYGLVKRGSVGVNFSFNETDFLVISSHFHSNLYDRNKSRRYVKRKKFMQTLNSFEVDGGNLHVPSFVFWLGNFNYVVQDLSVEESKDLLTQQAYKTILEKDSLHIERRLKFVLRNFREGEVKFAPTYPMKILRNEYNYGFCLPSYPDRCFYKANVDSLGVTCEEYTPLVDVRESEHFPVQVVYEVETLRYFVHHFLDTLKYRIEMKKISIANRRKDSVLREPKLAFIGKVLGGVVVTKPLSERSANPEFIASTIPILQFSVNVPQFLAYSVIAIALLDGEDLVSFTHLPLRKLVQNMGEEQKYRLRLKDYITGDVVANMKIEARFN